MARLFLRITHPIDGARAARFRHRDRHGTGRDRVHGRRDDGNFHRDVAREFGGEIGLRRIYIRRTRAKPHVVVGVHDTLIVRFFKERVYLSARHGLPLRLCRKIGPWPETHRTIAEGVG